MKTSTKIIMAVAAALLLVAVGVAVFMGTQNTGSDFDPILSDTQMGVAEDASTPEPVITDSPEETDETYEVSVEDTEIKAVDRIEEFVGTSNTVEVTITPEEANLGFTVTSSDFQIVSVEKNEDNTFTYSILEPGNTSINIVADNGKLKKIMVLAKPIPTATPTPTPVPTTQPTASTTYTQPSTTYTQPTQTYTQPTPTQTEEPYQNPDPNAFSDGDLNNYNPDVDAGNVNACEYTLDGQTYTADENQIPDGAILLKCWPK